ncbi:hypothetical protein [Flavobacterium urumqiense]|uniref:Uncharacterized protein n=1 Tax=Flavobacterium urumqiense TaxID=935224 RepID=A0A1H5V571_9FLAO|nr:hypothetical protein [Flavobacterium urumqiense]SEF82336.1 hypothetical protein SAMN04488130_10363 [Flavobacterium urumqiense]
MIQDAVMFSLIIDAPAVTLPNELPEDQLFSHFQNEIIELLENDIEAINYFGLVPDNGADGIDEVLFNGVLFRFDVPQAILGINLEAEPHLVRKAFLNVVENHSPSGNSVLEERGKTKLETTVVFEYYHL